MEEFGIVDKACYFCGHEQVVRFKEHYDFCPRCSAISTKMFTIESCEHFGDSAIIVSRVPWFASTRKELREKKKAYVIENDSEEETGKCSICGKSCTADGS